MKTMGAFAAKTHFSEMLLKVVNGEKFIITKHGKKVALLLPITQEESREKQIEGLINTMQKHRKGITLGKNLTIKDMISEGRA